MGSDRTQAGEPHDGARTDPPRSDGAEGATLSRRGLLQASAAASLTLLIAACGGDEDEATTAAERTTATGDSEGAATTERLEATPACEDGDDPTPEQTEGPFFTPSSPERNVLREPGMAGTPLVVSGLVLGRDCEPIRGALLDFWHCDDAGQYDNRGFRLRGHQFTDRDGRYRLETIVPAPYTPRTRHIHVKAQPQGGAVLTTQLYFPGEPLNESDGIFDPRLLMDVRELGDRRSARFDFVLET